MSPRPSRGFVDNFPATAGLLLVIAGFFVLEVVLASKMSQDPARGILDHLNNVGAAAVHLGSSVPLLVVQEGEVWRLLAACFLHGSWIHILFNCWVLMDLGRVCEPMLGTEKFITSFVLCGLSGSLASVGYHYFDAMYLGGHLGPGAVGASGALFGFIGLLLAFSIRHRDRNLRNHLLRWLMYMAILSVVLWGILDHAGHVGGFAGGFALGWFVPRYTSSAAASRWRIPCRVAIGLCVVSLGFSIWGMFQKLFEIQ